MMTDMSVRHRRDLSWLTGTRGLAAFVGVLWLAGQQMMKLGPGTASQSEAGGPAVFGWQEDLDLGAKPFPELVLRVRNEGEEPVHSVKLRVPVGVGGTFVRDLHSMGPGETQEVRVAIPAPPRSARVLTEVLFADSTGQQWLRTETGELRKLQEPPAFDAEPGAYKAEDHPTLRLQSEGRKVAN
jgi:hypothetical protein